MLKKRSLSPETLNMGDFANLPQPRSLTGCISSQRSYGATRLNLENAETKFLSHEVQNGDTLQRISVKYGVPVREWPKYIFGWPISQATVMFLRIFSS